ncbi:MAG: restriction endonuclease, SacI family, partial [Anaerolineae bacterium]|nr:restriction endonuclease, SacI family [Anaerolineae bacterium]
MEQSPTDILRLASERALAHGNDSLVEDPDTRSRIELICRNLRNRACARFVLATTLAKTYRPEVDIRKPYTEIGDDDSYSGRTFDEAYVTSFVMQHSLPCNPTTAFLTPAFRNRNVTLTPDLIMAGRPEELYKATLQLLTDIQTGLISASEVLVETIRVLLIVRDEQKGQIESLLSGLQLMGDTTALSAEAIVNLVEQHLKAAHSSRLPVLVVAAAYHAAEDRLGERVLPLAGHNAADQQTGALGDLEVTLVSDDKVITSYEMKTRRVTINDIDQALKKILNAGNRVDNYVFITTEPIEVLVKEYALTIYDQTGGIEIVILDCIDFLRHFLHLF